MQTIIFSKPRSAHKIDHTDSRQFLSKKIKIQTANVTEETKLLLIW